MYGAANGEIYSRMSDEDRAGLVSPTLGKVNGVT